MMLSKAFACSLLAVCWLLPQVRGQEPAANARADRWTPLFDGKTLAGWHKNPERIGHGTGGSWTVEAGAIVCEQDPPGSGNGGNFLTDK